MLVYGRQSVVETSRKLHDIDPQSRLDEMSLKYSKKLFDQLWHTFMTLHRPLTPDEEEDYKRMFTGVLHMHQRYHYHLMGKKIREARKHDRLS